MKIVSIIGSVRKNGNSTLASRYIAKELGAELEIVRLTDFDIQPCKACYACLYGNECKIDDDVDLIYEKIISGDKILISSPVYLLDATGSFKALLDRQLMAINYLKETSGKEAAIITSHGFENMKGWASSTHLVLARVLNLNVLVNAEINAALPGEILTVGENLEKLDQVVKSFKSSERITFDDQCPICLNTSFRVEDGVQCTVCGSKFDKDLNMIKKGERLQANWMDEHFERLEGMKEEYIERVTEIKKSVEKILGENSSKL